VQGVVWCGAYCMSYHTHAGCNEREYSNVELRPFTFARRCGQRVSVSVCVPTSMYPGICVNSFRVRMGKCRGGLGPLAGVANAKGPGCACLLSWPRSDTRCVSRGRGELPLRQRVFVGQAGNKCVKQIDDVHVGRISRGRKVVVGSILGIAKILGSKTVRLERGV
jgi:hypothetical protein